MPREAVPPVIRLLVCWPAPHCSWLSRRHRRRRRGWRYGVHQRVNLLHAALDRVIMEVGPAHARRSAAAGDTGTELGTDNRTAHNRAKVLVIGNPIRLPCPRSCRSWKALPCRTPRCSERRSAALWHRQERRRSGTCPPRTCWRGSEQRWN